MAETVEGGRYLVGGELVDANGKPVKGASGGDGAQDAGDDYPSADILRAGGFKDWQAVQGASDDDLLAVDGIGPSRLKEIRAHKG